MIRDNLTKEGDRGREKERARKWRDRHSKEEGKERKEEQEIER